MLQHRHIPVAVALKLEAAPLKESIWTSQTASQWVADILNVAFEGSIHLSALDTDLLNAL